MTQQLWQTICLSYQGDTKPCETPCLHCARIEEALAQDDTYNEKYPDPHAIKYERDELYGYVNGLLGLLQLVSGRDDMPTEIAECLKTNHRAVDAAAYLTQIAPPAEQP